MGSGQRKHFDQLAGPQLLKPDLHPVIESHFVPVAADFGAGLYEHNTFLVFQAVFLLNRPRNAFQRRCAPEGTQTGATGCEPGSTP